MMALRYNIHLHTNTFAHHIYNKETGETLVPYILEKREDIYEAFFAEARHYNKLVFQEKNPYVVGRVRAGWDLTTCQLATESETT
jgi:hypothetical protein